MWETHGHQQSPQLANKTSRCQSKVSSEGAQVSWEIAELSDQIEATAASTSEKALQTSLSSEPL